VTGSEIVGLVPLEPMLVAGRHYLAKQGRCTGVSEAELISTAILSLGLSDITPFDPQKKIIEYRIAPQEKLLKDMTVAAFVDELSSDSPAPGGGSVAALCGSLSAALSSMVANLTFGKKGFEKHNDTMNDIATRGQWLKKKFVTAIDDDTRAFNDIGAARRLPKDNDEQKAARDAAIEKANQKATLVPLSVVEAALEAVQLAEMVAEKGNPNTLSDAGVAGLTARAAADGAYYNVLINLPSVNDRAFKADVSKRADAAVEAVRTRTDKLHASVVKALAGQAAATCG
jgi:glutamate formiminotransferase / formiminotetrahydrofolate cyclodeaminase